MGSRKGAAKAGCRPSGGSAVRFYAVEQDTPEWHALRTGRATASAFGNIITPSKGTLSAGQELYASKLVAEKLLGRPTPETYKERAEMERGKALEPQAAAKYAFETCRKVLPGGFITTDDGAFGWSLDRLIAGHKGGLEIKCHNEAEHVRLVARGIDAEHKPQVQAQLWISELDWVDLYFYHPDFPSACYRCVRDEAYIAKMAQHAATFLATFAEIEAKVRAAGFDDALELAR